MTTCQDFFNYVTIRIQLITSFIFALRYDFIRHFKNPLCLPLPMASLINPVIKSDKECVKFVNRDVAQSLCNFFQSKHKIFFLLFATCYHVVLATAKAEKFAQSNLNRKGLIFERFKKVFFWGEVIAFFLFYNTQTMHIKSIKHINIAIFPIKKLTPWRDSSPGLLFLRRL
jgi:hypothetical protein